MKTKHINYFLIFFCAFFSFAERSSATTPTISNVAGTISTGQTITIAGSSMINDNSTNWLRNDEYSGSVLDQTYFTGATGAVDDFGWLVDHSGAPNNTSEYDSAVKVMGIQSVKLVDNTSCYDAQSCGAISLYGSFTTGSTTRLPSTYYVSAYVRFNGTYSDYGQKFYLTVGGTDQFYIQPSCLGDGTARGWAIKDGNWINGAGTFDPSANRGSFTWDTNKWHYFEAEIDTTHYSGDRFTIWIDGIQDTQWTAGGHSGALAMYNELGIPNWDGDPLTTVVPFTIWVTRYIFSSSRIYPASKIEVGSSSIYGSGNEKWQEPVYLSDGSIHAKLDLAGLGSGPYYLWVTNNRQERSAAYNLSGTSDTTSPAAPGGLTVN